MDNMHHHLCSCMYYNVIRVRVFTLDFLFHLSGTWTPYQSESTRFSREQALKFIMDYSGPACDYIAIVKVDHDYRD